MRLPKHHDARMRTTITLATDVFEEAWRTAGNTGRSFKDVVNDALRLGLTSMKKSKTAKPYRVTPKPMGLRKGLSYDKVADLLARAEGEGFK
jgi:hypothetical protein